MDGAEWIWVEFMKVAAAPGESALFAVRGEPSSADLKKALKGTIPLLEQDLADRDLHETRRLDELREKRSLFHKSGSPIDPSSGAAGSMNVLKSDTGRALLVTWIDDPL